MRQQWVNTEINIGITWIWSIFCKSWSFGNLLFNFDGYFSICPYCINVWPLPVFSRHPKSVPVYNCKFVDMCDYCNKLPVVMEKMVYFACLYYFLNLQNVLSSQKGPLCHRSKIIMFGLPQFCIIFCRWQRLQCMIKHVNFSR